LGGGSVPVAAAVACAGRNASPMAKPDRISGPVGLR
jgi:hypothetical protein